MSLCNDDQGCKIPVQETPQTKINKKNWSTVKKTVIYLQWCALMELCELIWRGLDCNGHSFIKSCAVGLIRAKTQIWIRKKKEKKKQRGRQCVRWLIASVERERVMAWVRNTWLRHTWKSAESLRREENGGNEQEWSRRVDKGDKG